MHSIDGESFSYFSNLRINIIHLSFSAFEIDGAVMGAFEVVAGMTADGAVGPVVAVLLEYLSLLLLRPAKIARINNTPMPRIPYKISDPFISKPGL